MAREKNRKFDQQVNTEETPQYDEELMQRMAERRRAAGSKRLRSRIIALLVIVSAFALFGTMCAKDIVRLKAENHALRKQQAALEKQRDELKDELKRVDNQEYIREQARKQLRLLNPGEILFTFDDDDEKESKADGN